MLRWQPADGKLHAFEVSGGHLRAVRPGRLRVAFCGGEVTPHLDIAAATDGVRLVPTCVTCAARWRRMQAIPRLVSGCL
jgi:hypothetical protein